MVRQVCELAVGEVQADLTLILDVGVETGLLRRFSTDQINTFDVKGVEFHERVRGGYLTEARMANLPVIDASGSMQEVAALIWQRVGSLVPVFT